MVLEGFGVLSVLGCGGSCSYQSILGKYLGRYQWPQFTWELCFVKWGNCWFYFCGIFWYFDLQYLFHRQATVFDWYSNKLSFSLNAVCLFFVVRGVVFVFYV